LNLGLISVTVIPPFKKVKRTRCGSLPSLPQLKMDCRTERHRIDPFIEPRFELELGSECLGSYELGRGESEF
jgi:hypothetical protein